MTQHGIPTTAREPVRWTPPALQALTDAANDKAQREGGEIKEAAQVFIRVPTPYERDAWGAALVRGGVQHYSKKQIRDAFMAGLAFLTPADQFEKAQHDIETLWAYNDAFDVMRKRQQERYNELAEANEALPEEQQRTALQISEEVEAEIASTVQLPKQELVRLVAIQQHIQSNYEPLHRMHADMAEQDTRSRWLCIETYVVGWSGLTHTPIGNGRGGITRSEAEWLYRQIGQDAFNEAADLIYAMHGLDGDEEKNLASLIESYSVLTGSTATESVASNEPGNSTDGSSTETHDIGSPQTTD